MQENNLVQHLLVQLLNPGMYNSKLLQLTLQEMASNGMKSYESQRFLFKNLKPAILPLQQEWVDKDFFNFFELCEQKNDLLLGTKCYFNILNLSKIIEKSGNKVACEIAKEIIKHFSNGAPSYEDTVLFENKNIKFSIQIKFDDYLKSIKNIKQKNDESYDYLSVVDNFIYKSLISDNMDFNSSQKVVDYLTKNNEEKDKILNFLIFMYNNQRYKISQVGFKPFLNYFIKDYKFISALVRARHSIVSNDRVLLQKFIISKYSGAELIECLNKNSDLHFLLPSEIFINADDIVSLKNHKSLKYFTLVVDDKCIVSQDTLDKYTTLLSKYLLTDSYFDKSKTAKYITPYIHNTINDWSVENFEKNAMAISNFPQVCRKYFFEKIFPLALEKGYYFDTKYVKYLTKDNKIRNEKNLLLHSTVAENTSKKVLKI